MENQNLEQNTEISEPVVAAPEQTSEVVNSTPEIEASSDKPVTSLDEAKKVLSKKPKSSAPTTSIPTTEPKTVDYEKQYKEIQSLVGKQSKELGELRKFYQENQQVINSYKQFLAQQQEQELLSKYQSDPMAVVKELARREALSQVAPYQEQISQAQASNINSTIKEQLGPDYDTYAPVMADLLDQFLAMDEANGSTYASELAQNPQILMQMAAGKVALQQKAQNAQQQQVAQVKKAQNLQIAQGVGRGNTVVSQPTDNFSNLSVDEMRIQMKKMGIIK